MIEIGSRNNAPTPQHQTQDIYLFHIDLSRPDTPFCLEQSIGGGHCEQGGAVWLAVSALEAWPGEWRQHVQKSGCGWVAELVERHPGVDQATLVSMILERHAESAKPVGRWQAIAGWFKRNIHFSGRYGV
ncbi:hypothetical protein [Pseudomonas frederiksbergensis]|uniref:hypothetical protein n=1 Tax=Pseudomonas frederiksbergensis TaxID=104087 RepID=UPI003D1B5527